MRRAIVFILHLHDINIIYTYLYVPSFTRDARRDNILMPSIILLLILLLLFHIRKLFNVINARFRRERTIGYWHRCPEIKCGYNGSCAVHYYKNKCTFFTIL